jgi:tetratricopeptide (TPR) repeat protein
MSFGVLHPSTKLLLRLFAFLNPDGILIEFLVSGAKALDDDLRQVISNRSKTAEALLELEKFSLIKWDRSNRSISIHRLVQTVVSDGMSDKELTSTLDSVIDLCYQSFPEEVTNETRPLCRKYQVQVVEPLLRMKTICSLKSAEIKSRVGDFLGDDGKYNDSEKLFLQVLKIYTHISGIEHSDTLGAMHHLALTYWQQGRNAEAVKLNEEVLEKKKRILGEEHPDTLATMGSLALTYWRQGHNAEAAKLGEEVLEKTKRILGEEHPDTFMAMGNLAFTYSQQGRNAEAAKLGEEALEKKKRILGEEHPDTIATMSNLASTYYNQQRCPAEVTKLFEEVLEKRKRIVGDRHPDTIFTMQWLVILYGDQDKMTEAMALENKVSELTEMRSAQGETT